MVYVKKLVTPYNNIYINIFNTFAGNMKEMKENYSEESIKTLDWKEHIRKRPGMYIGKLGDGTSPDDGIYVLLKEVVDNSIDEFMMGEGNRITITLTDDSKITIRDQGRGIPFGKLIDVVSKMNTGAKYNSKVFKKSVGLNGVGIKAVNALSNYFKIQTFREKKTKTTEFTKGILITETEIVETDQINGTLVTFTPDEKLFENYHFIPSYIINLVKNYTYLNNGLTIVLNEIEYQSQGGLKDLLNSKLNMQNIYPIIHLKSTDIELAFTHSNHHYGEEYYTFVNGQHTTQGGTHLVVFREIYIKTIRDFFNKNFDAADIRTSIIAALSIKIEEPVFESQTKTKLGSKNITPEGQTVKSFIQEFLNTYLDNYLHKNQEIANSILKKIQEAEKERKAISGIKKLSRERARKANLHNKKLRDCKIHYNSKHVKKQDSAIFITEGDSASGSITKSRDVSTQAVFSLKGKPLNTYGLSKKIVYENEEFSLLQAALNIENGIEELRYNNIIIATDADVDGMHIRLLLITFFLQFFSDLVKNEHLYILQTPLFRVRNKTKTFYCYSEKEKTKAIKKCGKNPEITRFKGLGEISPNEFKHFIGEEMRLEPIILKEEISITNLLEFYMGKNTPERQRFIVNNLQIRLDKVEQDALA